MSKEKKNKSYLNVNPGVDQPDSINKKAVSKFKSKKVAQYSSEKFIIGIKEGNLTILSKAITLIESSLEEHQDKAKNIIEACLPESGNSLRIGITGIPGAGKSTFLETLGYNLSKKGKKIAILAIDPSSSKSKGSILGDKTRMEKLSTVDNVFIRPSPSAGTLGGVARKTRETIILCEAAGYDTIFIETVGVGQSETAVYNLVDFFLLILLSGGGDELQGIKRGVMEMADLIAINKADGSNINKAELAKSEYQNALHYFPPSPSGKETKALTCSSIKNTGIDDIWKEILEYESFTKNNEYFYKKRNEQAKYWMHETIENELKSKFYNNPEIKKMLADIEQKLSDNQYSAFKAADILLNKYLKK